MVRVFIALELPEGVRQEIEKIQKSLPEFEGKLTEKENLHLTLKFLGEIDEEKLVKVKTQLGKVRSRKFQAELSELGVFTPSFLKIAWIEIKNCDGLQKEIDNKLGDLFKPEKRFMSHLTIARIKKADRKTFLNELGNIQFNKRKFLIDKFYLKKSTLAEKGPIYETILEVKLI